MSDEHEIEREKIGDAPPADRGAVLGGLLLVGAPAAFLVALTLRYSLTDPACAGAAGRIAMELATLIGVVAAAAAAWHGWKRVASRSYEPIRESADDGVRFVAASGFLIAVLFLLASVALWVPSLFLSPCVLR